MDILDNPEDFVTTLEGAVERLKVIHSEGNSPLTDDVVEVSQLCVALELVLRHQQKEKVSFWGERRDYWNYLSEAVGSIKTLEGIVRTVQAMPQLLTAQGRGRALIRDCLSDNMLAECLQNSVGNSKRTKEWYHSSAILLTPSLSQRVISALYDLTEVTFDLQSDGLDLDETWPSFVMKSFHGGRPEMGGAGVAGGKSLFNRLGSATREATKADPKRPSLQRSLLEHAVEEQPTEIFVKQEIPFDLGLVGTLLADIRKQLLRQEMVPSPQGSPSHLQGNSLPELQIAKLDDVTSCLTLLRDYITSWSRDVAENRAKLETDLQHLHERFSDLELQLQDTISESESSETNLLTQLQGSRDALKSRSEQLQKLTEGNASLRQELSEAKSKLSEAEGLNFSLEEQLVMSGSGEGGEGGEDGEGGVRRRAYTVLETTLSVRDEEISQLNEDIDSKTTELQALQTELLKSQEDLKHEQNLRESSQRLEEDLKSKLKVSKENELLLRSQYDEIQGVNADLSSALEGLKTKVEEELRGLKEKAVLESDLRSRMEQERDTAKAELESMHGLVENETVSFRFQLSSQAMELQQTKENLTKKDKLVSDLRSKLAAQECQLGEALERCEEGEEQISELKRELQDVEGVLSNSHIEMTSLHEQLTEKTLSRDSERSVTLKLQNKVDALNAQLQAVRSELSRKDSENEDIRKAFKKLLEQKVTLWQHADELEQEQVAMGTWIDDKTVTECMGCDLTFSVFNRKHHCRSCGKVYCSKCCDKKAQLPVSKDPVKVCDKCDLKITHMRTPMASKVINSLELEASLLLGVGSEPQQGTETAENSTPGGQDKGNLSTSSSGGGLEKTRTSSSSAGGLEGRRSRDFRRLSPRLNGSSNSLNIGRNVEYNGNSLEAKLRLQNSASPAKPSSSHTSTPHQHSRNGSLTNSFDPQQADGNPPPPPLPHPLEPGSSSLQDDTISFEGSSTFETAPTSINPLFDTNSIHSCSSVDYAVDPEMKLKEAEREKKSKSDVSYQLNSVDGATTDDSYYVIEAQPKSSVFPMGIDSSSGSMQCLLDVDALASKLASLEDSHAKIDEKTDPLTGGGDGGLNFDTKAPQSSSTVSTGFTSGNQGNMGGTESSELTLPGAGSHKVPVTIRKLGTAIVWEFSTEPKGLAFGISYQLSSKSSISEEVLPLRRCMSHKTTLTGEYVAQKAGVYILNFDNCHSKYSGRKLVYKVWTKLPL